ncbi:MAG: glycosyltransferase family 4 protein [Bdellovibrionales bacterium]|nr:glycosyltransferase family 4 protein [Bdellovibrionales bacterium]
MSTSQLQAVHTPLRRYAFIPPRFGEEVVGGAETLIANLASKLHARGNHVDIFTTCARDNRTWANEYKQGKSTAYGLPVERFSVDERDLESWIPKQIAISEGMALSVDDQLEWMAHSVNSQALYAHLAAERDNYDAFFFGPYLFGTTFWGSLISPEKSYLIPCLHDEYYAYTDVVRSMFRQVAGCIFNASPEMDLARALVGNVQGGEVGMGFEPLPQNEVDALTPYFEESFPYLVYVGRKETGKNAHLLIDFFIEAKENKQVPDDARLVILGGGDFADLHRPQALERGDVLDVGHVSERDKRRVIKHATALAQPSQNESFSIVLMEAWLLGTPVLVHAHCPVTRYHAIESGGGLYFAEQDDFNGVARELFSNQELCDKLAQAGREYVTSYYDWDAVLDRFDTVMDSLLDEQ